MHDPMVSYQGVSHIPHQDHHMSSKTCGIVSDLGTRKSLGKLALDLGYFFKTKRGKNPDLPAFLQAIADGSVTVSKKLPVEDQFFSPGLRQSIQFQTPSDPTPMMPTFATSGAAISKVAEDLITSSLHCSECSAHLLMEQRAQADVMMHQLADHLLQVHQVSSNCKALALQIVCRPR